MIMANEDILELQTEVSKLFSGKPMSDVVLVCINSLLFCIMQSAKDSTDREKGLEYVCDSLRKGFYLVSSLKEQLSTGEEKEQAT